MDSVVKRVAIAMCEADGLLPFEAIEAEVQQSTLARVTQTVERWQTYTDQAARFIAALRAVIS